jgi:hypothetical protein
MKPNQIAHPGTPKVICSISVAIVLSLLLTTSLAQGAYTPLKYLLSFALLYSSGFFLMPRRRVLIRHPDHGDDRVWVSRIQKIYTKIDDWSKWIEIDRLTGESTDLTKKGSVPCNDDKIKNIALNKFHALPISINTSITLALLALFFNPLAGIGMEKIDWICADVALAIYLMFVLLIVLKEKKSPRCEIITCDNNGVYSNIDWEEGFDNGWNRHDKRVIRCWPAIMIFMMLLTAFSLNASESLYISLFALFGVFIATAFNMLCTYIFGYLILGAVRVCWGQISSVRLEYSLAIYCALFMVFATSEAARYAGRLQNDSPASQADPDYEGDTEDF